MSLRKQKNRKYFINVLHGKKQENHRVLINERIFYLNDIKRWRLYLKLILQYINYLCETNSQDINLFLKGVINEVIEESNKFKRRMGYILGDWSDF